MSDLTPGRFYTMGAMKHRCGDRSYIGHVWEVLAVNGSSAVIKDAAPKYEHSFGAQPLIVCIAEFDWEPADDLLAVLAEYAAPTAFTKAAERGQ